MSKRPAIITRLMGGLGNQMFQYAVARRLVGENDADILFDVSYLGSEATGLTPRKYGLDKFAVRGRIASESEIREVLGAGPRRFLVKAWNRVAPIPYKTVVYEAGYAYEPGILKARPTVYLSGYWQSPAYFEQAAEAIRRDFQLKNGLTPSGAQWLRKIEAAPAVSIHVRRGDFLHNPLMIAFHGTTDAGFYKAALQHVTSKAKVESVFVFTDEPEWVRKNLDIGRNFEIVAGAGDAPDQEELTLMAACQHHIISNSSFGWWGAWLGRNRDKVMVAPKQWFAGAKEEPEIFGAAWHRI